jgi:diguanylate cyclase (GGDEF)-like protein/PAS domain S-box-containing protein
MARANEWRRVLVRRAPGTHSTRFAERALEHGAGARLRDATAKARMSLRIRTARGARSQVAPTLCERRHCSAVRRLRRGADRLGTLGVIFATRNEESSKRLRQCLIAPAAPRTKNPAMSQFFDLPPRALSERPLDPARDNVELALALRELARTKTELERVERCWGALTEALEEGVILLDERGRVIAVNRSAAAFFGDEAAVRRWIWEYADEAGTTSPNAVHPAMATLLDGNPRSSMETTVGTGADMRWLTLNTRAVLDPETRGVATVVCSFADITARKRRQDDLERQATVDPLTGAFNRRYFDSRLAAETSRARRFRQPLALALADLDHFKGVNDRHGHAAGDRALAIFVKILAQTLRTEDVIARIGGDEFCMLFPGTPARAATIALERVLARLRMTDIEGDTGAFQVSGTFGIVDLAPGMSAAELIAQADAALYAAKAAGRGRVGAANP